MVRKDKSGRGKTIKIWRTLKLGTGLKTADNFRAALKAGNYHVSDQANNLLGKLTARKTEKEVGLVKVSSAELGCKNGATWRNIYKRAREHGLKRCPVEVGLQLRLQDKGHPYGELLHIGMEPIVGLDGPNIFILGHDSFGRWLGCSRGDPVGFWRGGEQWVFVRSK